MVPRALWELLWRSPRQHPSDTTCFTPRQLCSNQGSHRRLSSASLTHTAFHNSLFPSVSHTSTAAKRRHPGRVRQPGHTNSHHSSKRKPGGSGCRRSGATQVESSSPAPVRMCSFLPCHPRESQQEAGKAEVLYSAALGSSMAVSHRPGESRTKEDHRRSEMYSYIPAKSHYRPD